MVQTAARFGTDNLLDPHHAKTPNATVKLGGITTTKETATNNNRV